MSVVQRFYLFLLSGLGQENGLSTKIPYLLTLLRVSGKKIGHLSENKTETQRFRLYPCPLQTDMLIFNYMEVRQYLVLFLHPYKANIYIFLATSK